MVHQILENLIGKLCLLAQTQVAFQTRLQPTLKIDMEPWCDGYYGRRQRARRRSQEKAASLTVRDGRRPPGVGRGLGPTSRAELRRDHDWNSTWTQPGGWHLSPKTTESICLDIESSFGMILETDLLQGDPERRNFKGRDC